MFAAFDWNQVLMKAVMGGILGGIGGACIGLIAYLSRKSDAQRQSEMEAQEWARIRGRTKAATAEPLPRWALYLFIAVVTFSIGAFANNPLPVAPFFRGGGGAGKPVVTVSDSGRYRDKTLAQGATDPNAPAAAVRVREMVFLQETDQIPCQIGETWGFRLRSSDVPTDRPYTVRKEVLHPPFKQPDGSILTKSVSEYKLGPGTALDRFCGWYFLKGYEYELVPGEWTIVVYIDEVEVARKVFHVQKS